MISMLILRWLVETVARSSCLEHVQTPQYLSPNIWHCRKIRKSKTKLPINQVKLCWKYVYLVFIKCFIIIPNPLPHNQIYSFENQFHLTDYSIDEQHLDKMARQMDRCQHCHAVIKNCLKVLHVYLKKIVDNLANTVEHSISNLPIEINMRNYNIANQLSIAETCKKRFHTVSKFM